jgi:HEAT repeat protein
LNVRYHAIEALGKLKSCEAVDPLLKLTESRDFSVAFPALDALASIGDGRAGPPLTSLLDDLGLRLPAIEALGSVGGEEAVAPLIGLLHENRELAAPLASALTRLRERYETRYGRGDRIEAALRRAITAEGTKFLIEAAAGSDAPELAALAHVLGWLDSADVDRTLAQLLAQPASRSAATEALVRHGARVTDVLVERLRDDDVEVRRTAVATLGRIGDAKAVPALLATLKDDPESIVAAAGALAMIGDRQAYPTLLEFLGDENAAVRRAVVSALNSLGHPQMAVDMERCLGDADPRVRESAVCVVGYGAFPTCVEALLECCCDENEQVRRVALDALPALDDRRVLPALAEGLADTVSGVRSAAARALGQIEGADVRPLFERAIADKSSWVRYYAVRSSVRRENSASLETLSRLAQADPAMQVRVAAMESLGTLGDASSVPLLAALTRSPVSDLVRTAIAALGTMRRLDALPPLLAALESPDPAQRIDVLRALGASGPADAVAVVQRLATSDIGPGVAKTAVETLGRISGPEAITALVSLCASPSLRADCVKALSRIADGNEEFVGHGLNDPRPDVRLAVVDALTRAGTASAPAHLRRALEDADASVRFAAGLAVSLRDCALHG